MKLRVWGAVLVAVLALTGCGGDDEASNEPSDAAAPTLDEWIDVALSQCKQLDKATTAAEPKGDPFSPKATDKDRKQGVAFLATFGSELKKFADTLEDKGYPQEKAAAAQGFVKASRDAAKAFDTAATTAKKDMAKAQPAVGAAFGTVGALDAAAKKVGIGDIENCKREGEQAEKPAAGAKQVAVVATKKGGKYTFEFAKSIPAGKTAFALENKDDEAHFMAIAEVTGPGALKKAIAAEASGDSKGADKFIKNEEVGGSKDAAPGEQAVANVDLKPGTYGMLCFIPGPDGKPHAFSGMAVEFEVK